MERRTSIWASVLFFVVLLYGFRQDIGAWAFSVTGEDTITGQVRGVWQLAGSVLRATPRMQASTEIPLAQVDPFGVNTFLEQEVETVKRARQVELIAAAGFHWLRQEFPWYDIEIHAKGDFEDRRAEPHRSAWDKYDHIVALASDSGMEIIVRLSSPPEWSQRNGGAAGAFAPPESYHDFSDYAVAVVERYEGKVNHYQIWNEPNIYPEWGKQPVSPEAYTELLCLSYHAIKRVHPSVVVLAAALAPTVALTERDLNDFLFLERMYQAGAGECFDVMSVQGYGLWSGPTDRRMHPGKVNYGRHQFIRDIMVAHGDASKPIWISEMNWNAVPEDSGLPAIYGRVSLEQQARWAPLAYERARDEWPWVGVVSFWYFKRADASEIDQSWYYFRMLEPDFTMMPVYTGIKNYITSNPYVKSAN
ncbi:MAG: cellulase family glycosylhydrolase [Anaerolineales bacterium]|nr:cellulase family glycosylhydrolase [Anaerolineales bacterium]